MFYQQSLDVVKKIGDFNDVINVDVVKKIDDFNDLGKLQ